MLDKVFIDTNILIYGYSSDNLEKSKRIEEIRKSIPKIIISTQVINEFVNVLYRKRKVSYLKIHSTLKKLYKHVEIVEIDLNTIHKAIKLAYRYRYSYFDSLMIASALENECPILYSEDMHNSHKIENKLTIVNPFKL